MAKLPSIDNLLKEVRACEVCREHLPLGPRPILSATSDARVLIVGQAPGTRVHESGIPWNDASGDRLREWMEIDKDTFYDASRIAIVPMGFCYPGKGKSGDNPPRPECAPLWHARLLKLMPKLELTLLVGQYAQKYYLGERCKKNLTETVANFKEYLPEYLPMVHPSPRNRIWVARNPWFEKELLPVLRKRVNELL